ncbi:hypothetical protein C4D60_Mb01t23860 [Musa balbisiana]|uniref:Uncharacterized protein n=1 Tax=Musa balbisiana TaxID=52838 RepID=A0A4S8JPT1_MUSBA|nr:hypothetical protein C4D60_Mb01t23860 [Musa balbisiana]
MASTVLRLATLPLFFYPSRNIIVPILGLYNHRGIHILCLRRPENIRRNDEMMASLVLGRKVSDLAATLKRTPSDT